MNKGNPMTLADVTTDTPIDISRLPLHLTTAGKRGSNVYVRAIKSCGCDGPHLGHVEVVVLPRPSVKSNTKPPKPNYAELGYEVRIEATDRVGLYLNGERLYGRRSYGNHNSAHYIQTILDIMARDHTNGVARSKRPRKPNGAMFATVEAALQHRPRTPCKLWAIFPERPRRYNRNHTVGYVWGMEQAA